VRNHISDFRSIKERPSELDTSHRNVSVTSIEPRRSDSTSWELMEMAARGVPVPRRELRKAIRRARPQVDAVLCAGDADDPGELGVARFRCTVIFGALGRLWGLGAHEVEELWTSGLLDSALADEFDPLGRLGIPPLA
jgi:hypothetical protein